jgi:hypothetical protein
MSFFQNPSFYIQTAETDIVKFFKSVEAEASVIEQDFLNALGWVQSNASEIAAFVAGLLGVAAATGTGQIPAALLTAASALNTGMQLVNSAVAAAQSTQSAGGNVNAQTVAALSAAYVQFKNAEVAAAGQAAIAAKPAAAPST